MHANCPAARNEKREDTDKAAGITDQLIRWHLILRGEYLIRFCLVLNT
jgi:hypothetical protein